MWKHENKEKYKTRQETGKDNQRRKEKGKVQPNDQVPNKSRNRSSELNKTKPKIDP